MFLLWISRVTILGSDTGSRVEFQYHTTYWSTWRASPTTASEKTRTYSSLCTTWERERLSGRKAHTHSSTSTHRDSKKCIKRLWCLIRHFECTIWKSMNHWIRVRGCDSWGLNPGWKVFKKKKKKFNISCVFCKHTAHSDCLGGSYLFGSSNSNLLYLHDYN